MNVTSRHAALALSLLCVTALVAAGCGRKAEEKQAELAAERTLSAATGKKVDVDLNGNDVRIQTEGGQTSITATDEWPGDMLAGVPAYPGGKVERVVRGTEGPRKTINVYLNGLEPAGLEQYAESLRQAGWNVQQMAMGEKGGMISGQKPGFGLTFTYSLDEHSGMLAVFTATD